MKIYATLMAIYGVGNYIDKGFFDFKAFALIGLLALSVMLLPKKHNSHRSSRYT